MKKIFIIISIIALCLVFAACSENTSKEINNTTTIQAENTTKQEQETLICVTESKRLTFYVSDDGDDINSEIMSSKIAASTGNDRSGLADLEYYYKSAYIEQYCKLTQINFNGGEDGNIVLVYKLIAPQVDRAFTLQFNRDGAYGNSINQQLINGSGAIPFEPCGAVYYTDVYNPGDNGELSLTQFFWVHDGYSFMMQVWPEVMEQILENDPNALKGALFELEKVMLETPSDDNTVTE